MLQSAKTFTYIWSIGWSYDMFNLVGHHFPYFMAILLPFYGFFWPKMAIFGHRQSQQPQIGWTLGEQGWTLFSTSGGISLGLLDHTEMSLGALEPPKMAFFRLKKAIFGHRQSRQPQIGWTLGEQGWIMFSTSGGVSLGLLAHPEMSVGGLRSAENGLFWPKMAIFGHRQSPQAQMGWTLVEHGWTLSNTSRGVCLGL